MFVKNAVLPILAASFIAVNAAPELEHRQIDSVFNSLTSVAASVITGDGASVIGDITSVAGGVFSTVTSVGGKAVTVITSAGGQAITLAGDAGGVVTSFGGSVYTAATGAAGSAASDALNSSNAAVGASPIGFTSSHAMGLVTVVCSALIGAMITL
ncbi:hypothetical protein Hypma_015631 [Hypsizygus marmoreus]|uniref:Uncharacterized protein n=1 Tax=Hypsizygus marmoreus TaxID=39966 RepID=A0A369K1Y2_HYPMA|nr:hypothetical protein Hypma_015631 [Hypsizygus marmoreus]